MAASGCLGEMSASTMECPELCLLCTAQQFRVLLALPVQTPVPASWCGWKHRNPSQFARICPSPSPLASDTGTAAHRESVCVWGAPVHGRCVWALLCRAFQQADAETCFKKKKKLWMLQNAVCSVDESFHWPQEASWLSVHSPLLHWGFSHTLISGVSTVR